MHNTQPAEYDRIILGIDPGTNIMGYGIIGCTGKKVSVISLGIVKLDKLDNHALKLKHIFERCLYLIDTYHPDEMALEAPFFGKNVQSMLKLGRAQGVAMAAALYRDLPIFEYAPRSIKLSITGSGAASKEQVASLLQHQLHFTETPQFLDATDGLAAAYCHFLQRIPASKTKKPAKKAGSWKSFLDQNPERIRKTGKDT
ncbi:MAG TPA: crossover junction endodeoxyribonuclease RuvC [Bacteroidia bacterium]|nr:crossover junction endodeoxyribonuclease RuvC [Bacteroidia bacterium]